MDEKNCNTVITGLINDAKKPGANLTIPLAEFEELFFGLSPLQVLPVLKLLTDQGIIVAEHLSGDPVHVYVPIQAFGYLAAKQAEKEARSKQKREDRRWELFKINYQAVLGFALGVAATLIVQRFIGVTICK